jgi:excisionase family DNA binding protein
MDLNLADRTAGLLSTRPDLDDDEIATGVMRTFADQRSLERAVEDLVTAEVARRRDALSGRVAVPSEPDSILCTCEVAELLHISEMTVYRWVDQRRLNATRLPGARGLYRFRRSDVEAHLPAPAGTGGA